MILEMIRDLPRHSRLAVRRSLQVDAGEKDDLPDFEGLDEALKYAEARRWNEPGQELGALTVNELRRLFVAVPQWKDRPEVPMVGPREWWTDKQRAEHDKQLREEHKKQTPEESASVLDVMAHLGFQTGGNSGGN